MKPIRTEADYDSAMEEIASLWGAVSGTPEGDRLDVLATLIDAHEPRSIMRWTHPHPIEA